MRPKSFHATVVDRLAAMIIGEEDGIRSQLPTEAELCQSMGVSRTILREAVKTLAAKGMLVTGPRTGTRTLPPSQWNLLDPDVINWRLAAGVDQTFVRDIMELRFAIEPKASRFAALRATEDDIAALYEAYDLMVTEVQNGGSGYLKADLAFHRGNLKAARNQFFSTLEPAVSTLFQVSFHFSVKSRELARLALREHKAVADAIANRNPDQAEQEMQALLNSAHEVINTDMTNDDFLQTYGDKNTEA